MPNGSAATTYTASAVPAATAASRTLRWEHSTMRPAISTAGTDSAFIDTAPPAARPTHTALRTRGSSR